MSSFEFIYRHRYPDFNETNVFLKVKLAFLVKKTNTSIIYRAKQETPSRSKIHSPFREWELEFKEFESEANIQQLFEKLKKVCTKELKTSTRVFFLENFEGPKPTKQKLDLSDMRVLKKHITPEPGGKDERRDLILGLTVGYDHWFFKLECLYDEKFREMNNCRITRAEEIMFLAKYIDSDTQTTKKDLEYLKIGHKNLTDTVSEVLMMKPIIESSLERKINAKHSVMDQAYAHLLKLMSWDDTSLIFARAVISCLGTCLGTQIPPGNPVGEWQNPGAETDMFETAFGTNSKNDGIYYNETPRIEMFRGLNGQFAFEDAHQRFNNYLNVIQANPSRQMAGIFVKNDTASDVVSKFYYKGSSAAVAGLSLSCGVPDQKNSAPNAPQTPKVGGITWTTLSKTASAAANYASSCDITVPAQKTVCILLYTSAFSLQPVNNIIPFYLMMCIYNFKQFLGNNLRIDIPRTIKCLRGNCATVQDVWN